MTQQDIDTRPASDDAPRTAVAPLLTIQVTELGEEDRALDASAVFTRSTSTTCSTS